MPKPIVCSWLTGSTAMLTSAPEFLCVLSSCWKSIR